MRNNSEKSTGNVTNVQYLQGPVIMKQTPWIYVLSGTLLLSGCGIKTHLQNEELDWMNVYNANDTLIFKSQTGELDTSIIVLKEFFYPEYNPIESHGKWLPHHATIWYKNKHLNYHPDGYKLVSMIKRAPKGKTFLSINYQYNGYLFQNITPDSLKKFLKDEVYSFSTDPFRNKPTQPQRIFWHKKYGLIKYITYEGVAWERINLPVHSKQ